MSGAAGTEVSYSSLSDFDWSVRLALSSDKLSGLRTPLLLLKLETRQPDNSVKDIVIEMNVEEAKHFLATLKKGQSVANSIL